MYWQSNLFLYLAQAAGLLNRLLNWLKYKNNYLRWYHFEIFLIGAYIIMISTVARKIFIPTIMQVILRDRYYLIVTLIIVL